MIQMLNGQTKSWSGDGVYIFNIFIFLNIFSSLKGHFMPLNHQVPLSWNKNNLSTRIPKCTVNLSDYLSSSNDMDISGPLQSVLIDYSALV